MIIRNTENFKSKVTVTFKNDLPTKEINPLIENWMEEGHEIKASGLSPDPKIIWLKFFSRESANVFSEKIVSLKNKNI